MLSLLERKRRISIAPLQISSPMNETMSSKESKERNQKEEKQLLVRGLRSFFSCKYHQTAVEGEKRRKVRRIGWSGSLCNLRDSSKVMHRPEPTTSSSSSPSLNLSASTNTSSSPSASSSLGGSFRGMHLRRISGCYESHMAADPLTSLSKVPSLRINAFPCPQCGELITKSDSLELHQAAKHAVSELGPEDNSRNIVEIIFKSSWLKKQAPKCKIDRILKVHQPQKTLTRFEAYRDSIKIKASKLAKKHPRCIADGNELLRFHCTTFSCSLGRDGSTGLCLSVPNCNLCSIIRDGFKLDEMSRIKTMETSGRANDMGEISADCKERAMLVCRVIAGTVSKNQEGGEDSDSMAGTAGGYSCLDELFVFDPKAILPCFVVIYRNF